MFAYASSYGIELGVDTSGVIRRLLPIALMTLCAFLTACGEDEPAAIPGEADPADVEVIDRWARTLAGGDIEGAADFFAIPSVAENGSLLEIEDQADARRFNAALPCGAELIRAETQGRFTTATFELTERPGAGVCGGGTGGTAQTVFVIENGLIVEWRRVGVSADEGPRRVS